jgi:hypothetical protein
MPPQLRRQLDKPLQGDRLHNGVLAREMAVQHGLAVLDAFGQPSRGDRVPAVGLG